MTFLIAVAPLIAYALGFINGRQIGLDEAIEILDDVDKEADQIRMEAKLRAEEFNGIYFIKKFKQTK